MFLNLKMSNYILEKNLLPIIYRIPVPQMKGMKNTLPM